MYTVQNSKKRGGEILIIKDEGIESPYKYISFLLEQGFDKASTLTLLSEPINLGYGVSSDALYLEPVFNPCTGDLLKGVNLEQEFHFLGDNIVIPYCEYAYGAENSFIGATTSMLLNKPDRIVIATTHNPDGSLTTSINNQPLLF